MAELIAGGKVRAYTTRSWNWIALVMPNLVVFMKEKATGEWHRRQHMDHFLTDKGDSACEAIDSLWGINGKVDDEGVNSFDEIPEPVVEDLWAECQEKMNIESVESVTPTRLVIRENLPEPQ